MRRNEQNRNPTLDSAQRKDRNIKYDSKTRKASPLINPKRSDSPTHIDSSQRQRKGNFDQTKYLNTIQSDQNHQKASTPKAQYNFNQNNTQKSIKYSSPASDLFLTQKEGKLINQVFTRNQLITFFDTDDDSKKQTGDNTQRKQQNDIYLKIDKISRNRIPEREKTRRLREARYFNSRYYKPERLNQIQGQDYEEDLDDILNIYAHTESDSDSSIDIQDDISVKSTNSTKQKKLPTLNSTSEYIIPTSQVESDFVDFSSLPPMPKQKGQKKTKPENLEDSTSEFFFSGDEIKKQDDSSPVDILLELHNNQSETGKDLKNNNPQLTDSFLSTSDSEEEEDVPIQYQKRFIRIKKKRIVRRRVPKNRSPAMRTRSTTFQYAVARSINGRPLHFHILKGNDPVPSNSAIVQIDATRRVIVRANEPLEITQNEHYDSFPPNSVIVLPNQSIIQKQYAAANGGFPQPQVSPYVVTNLEDTPPHFIFIPPDEDLPPDAYLVARDSRIRIAIQGNLILRRIGAGQPLPPNSIRVLSSITQPRRTVCIVNQSKTDNIDEDESEFHLITVRNGEEYRLPYNSIFVNRGKYTKTAIISSDLRPLRYITIPEGSIIPKNSIVVSSNVLRNKPPKMAVTTSKQIQDFLSFSTVKNQANSIPLNSIVMKNDDSNVLAIVPFTDNNKLSVIQVNENIPENALLINFENDFLISSVVATSSDNLNIGTTKTNEEYPKHSIILKQDSQSTVSLFGSESSPIKAVPLNSKYSYENSYIVENMKDNNIIAAIPSSKLSTFDFLTLKSIDEIPQNTLLFSNEELNGNSNESRITTVIPSNSQPLRAIRINSKNINEAVSKLPKQSLLLNNSRKPLLYPQANFCVTAPDGKPLSVMTIKKEEDLPQNSVLVTSTEEYNVVAMSSNGESLEFNALYNQEEIPPNSMLLSKHGKIIDENNKFLITACSNDEKALKLMLLNEEEGDKCPQNSIPIKKTDLGLIVAVAEDGGPLHLEAVPKGENIPANSIVIPSEDNKADNSNYYLTADDSTPLEFITTDNDSKLPSNSIIVNSNDNKIAAIHSAKPIHIITVNENEEIPKNSILFDVHPQSNPQSEFENQKIAFVTANNQPLRIVTLKASDELPENAKIIKQDEKTSVAIISPDSQPLLLSTFNNANEVPDNSFFIDPHCEDFRAAIFSSNGQLDLKAIVNEDEITTNSLIIKSDNESTVCLFAPENEILSIVSLKEGEKEPENSYVISGKSASSLFVPNQLHASTQDLSNEDRELKSRLIVESNTGELLHFITLPATEKQPPNSMSIPHKDDLPYISYIVSPDGKPLKLVSPDSYDNGEHENAIDISQPQNFFVSSPNGTNMSIAAFGNNQQIPQNSAIISYDDQTLNVVVGDPYLQVNSRKENHDTPNNSIQPMISKKIEQQSETRIAVFADKTNPLYLITLKPNESSPHHSIRMIQNSEKALYLVSTNENPINCHILNVNEEIPDHSFIFERKGTQMVLMNPTVKFAIFAQNQNRLLFMTINKNAEYPMNSFIVDGDGHYNRIIVSPTDTPLFVCLLNENEEPINNSFVYHCNDDSIDHFKSYKVASADDSQLHAIMIPEGETLPNNSIIISQENSRVTAVSTAFNSRNLVLFSNTDKDIPKNYVSFDSKDRYFAVASTSQQPLAYTILRNGGSVPRNALVVNKEGGINGRSLAVYAGEGQRLVYWPLNDENTNIPPNAITISKEPTENERNEVQLAVRSPNGKPMKFLIVNPGDELPENEVTLRKEANGRKVVLQDSNAKPLQYFLIGKSDPLPKNSVIVPSGDKPIEKIVVVSSKQLKTPFSTAPSSARSASSHSTVNQNESCDNQIAEQELPINADMSHENASEVVINENDEVPQPLDFVVLKPGEEVLPTSAVVITEGGRKPRRLAVKPPEGHSLKYIPLHEGEATPPNSITVCQYPLLNSTLGPTKGDSNGIFNSSDKTMIAVTSIDYDKPFQYIIVKHGDHIPRSALELFKEGGETPRTVSIISQNEKDSPLTYFFVNPGCELPPHSLFVDTNEITKSISIIPESGQETEFEICELDENEELLPNSIVVATKDNKRIILKTSDNSPLKAMLTKPGREPKNGFVLATPCDDEQNANDNNVHFIEQIELIKAKMAKRNEISIENTEEEQSQENQLENTLSQVLTALNLSLNQSNIDSPTNKRKKKLIKRRKKKKEDEIDSIENDEEEKLAKLLLLEENEKLLSSCIGESFTDNDNYDNNDTISKDNDNNDTISKDNDNNDNASKDNENTSLDNISNDNENFQNSEIDSELQSSISLQAVNSSPPFERIFAPSAFSLSIPLTFESPKKVVNQSQSDTETLIEEEEEDNSQSNNGQIPHRIPSDIPPSNVDIQPKPKRVSRRHIHGGSLIKTEEELRQFFFDSPLKIVDTNDQESSISGYNNTSGNVSSRFLNLSSRNTNNFNVYPSARSILDDNTNIDSESTGIRPMNDLNLKNRFFQSSKMIDSIYCDDMLATQSVPHKKSKRTTKKKKKSNVEIQPIRFL